MSAETTHNTRHALESQPITLVLNAYTTDQDADLDDEEIGYVVVTLSPGDIDRFERVAQVAQEYGMRRAVLDAPRETGAVTWGGPTAPAVEDTSVEIYPGDGDSPPEVVFAATTENGAAYDTLAISLDHLKTLSLLREDKQGLEETGFDRARVVGIGEVFYREVEDEALAALVRDTAMDDATPDFG
jgi:hypothetical protein